MGMMEGDGLLHGKLDKGFVVTTADTIINYARTGSLWPMTFGLACCARAAGRVLACVLCRPGPAFARRSAACGACEAWLMH